jgi:hypothetical protein
MSKAKIVFSAVFMLVTITAMLYTYDSSNSHIRHFRLRSTIAAFFSVMMFIDSIFDMEKKKKK